jgi:hypothetical protein
MQFSVVLLSAIPFVSTGCLLSASTLYTFDFSSPTGKLGVTQSYTADPVPLPALSITLSGFRGTGVGVPHRLFGKQDLTSDENGVGLDDLLADEITRAGFVQIDLKPLTGAGNLTAFALMFGSVTGRDGWTVYGTNTSGSLAGAKNLKSGSTDFGIFVSFSSIPATRYIDVIASGGRTSNILLSQLRVSLDDPDPQATAEPGTFPLMAIALAGLGARRLRHYRLRTVSSS